MYIYIYIYIYIHGFGQGIHAQPAPRGPVGMTRREPTPLFDWRTHGIALGGTAFHAKIRTRIYLGGVLTLTPDKSLAGAPGSWKVSAREAAQASRETQRSARRNRPHIHIYVYICICIPRGP